MSGSRPLVLLLGAGDLATGVAARLYRSGFAVACTEIAKPLAERLVRRCRLRVESFFDPVVQSFGEDRNSRRAKLMMRLRALPTEQLRDEASCRRHLKASIEEQVNSLPTHRVLSSVAVGWVGRKFTVLAKSL